MPFYSTPDNPDKRERILYAALLLFSGKGYANTSVHEVRAKADVSIGLIYRYFKNKEEIAKALYVELLNDATEGLEKLIEQYDTIEERCHAILDYYFQRTEKYPEVVDYVLFFRHKEMFAEVGPICAAQPAAIIAKMLIDAMEAGTLKSMPPLVMQATIFGCASRLMQMRLQGMLSTPLPELLDQVWENTWLAVRPN